jgi:hypothetical protein
MYSTNTKEQSTPAGQLWFVRSELPRSLGDSAAAFFDLLALRKTGRNRVTQVNTLLCAYYCRCIAIEWPYGEQVCACSWCRLHTCMYTNTEEQSTPAGQLNFVRSELPRSRGDSAAAFFDLLALSKTGRNRVTQVSENVWVEQLSITISVLAITP